MRESNKDLATISFQPEACETAAAFFARLCASQNRGSGLTVTVVPKAEWASSTEHARSLKPFDAEMRDVIVGQDDGQFKLVVAPWIEGEDGGDRTNLITLDIYDDLERIEVI